MSFTNKMMPPLLFSNSRDSNVYLLSRLLNVGVSSRTASNMSSPSPRTTSSPVYFFQQLSCSRNAVPTLAPLKPLNLTRRYCTPIILSPGAKNLAFCFCALDIAILASTSRSLPTSGNVDDPGMTASDNGASAVTSVLLLLSAVCLTEGSRTVIRPTT
jgi:hypothetical protein